jgi:myo-inositol-1(or 4)-monophosphatase
MLGDLALLQVAHDAVDLASQIMLDASHVVALPKGDRDVVTGTDLAVERTVRSLLAEQAPGVGFLGEEEGTAAGGEMTWVLDPVDGTVNFWRGIPLCGISLALVRENRPVIGVIDLPFLKTRYWAAEGRGAMRDGQPISASRVGKLAEAVIGVGDYATGPGAPRMNHARLEVTRQLAASAMRVRMLGTAAVDLAWTADGKLDGMVTLSNHPWDMAAGALIAGEAGATVIDANRHPYNLDATEVIAGSRNLAGQIAAIAQSALQAL